MSDIGRKVWIGCGIGCGLLAMAAIAVLIAGWGLARSTARPMESAVDARRALEASEGAAEAYRAPADGSIPADRWEAFVAVREETDAARRELGTVFERIRLDPDELKAMEDEGALAVLGETLGIVRASFGLARRLGEFLEARNVALLRHEMGMGEYTYLHALAFGSGPPPDAPEMSGTPDLGPAIGAGSRDRRHALLLAILEDQLRRTEDPDWRDALGREVEAFRDDPDRRLWPEGLPPRLAAGLEPFRERIEATAVPGLEGLETSLQRKVGRMSYTIE